MTRPPGERVLVLGGPLNGAICELKPDASRHGFFVHSEGEGDDEHWWGYYAHETRDGFRVFRPGKPK
jgi:hypothetical protein